MKGLSRVGKLCQTYQDRLDFPKPAFVRGGRQTRWRMLPACETKKRKLEAYATIEIKEFASYLIVSADVSFVAGDSGLST